MEKFDDKNNLYVKVDNKIRNEIIPYLKTFESVRKRILRQHIVLTLSIFLAIFAFFALHIYWDIKIKRFYEGFIAIMLICGLAVIRAFMQYFVKTARENTQYIKKSYEVELKEKVLNDLCSCFENLKWKTWDNERVYRPDIFKTLLESKMISSQYLAAEDIAQEYDDYNSIARIDATNSVKLSSTIVVDDIFNGQHKGINFEIIETKMGENRSAISYNFLIIALDMNKKFQGVTGVESRSILETPMLESKSPMKEIHLEDIEFEKKYKAYSTDEIEARYLLTPRFMERIKDIEKYYKSNQTTCIFNQKKFIIVLKTKSDMFKIFTLSKKLDDVKPYYNFFHEINSVLRLIDHFKLDQKIGM